MQKKTAIRIILTSAIAVVFVGVALTTRLFFATAQGPRVLYGETVTGDIVSAGDDDTWTFDGVRGDIIVVSIERTDGTLIPSIALADPDATLIVELAAQNAETPVTQFTIGLQQGGTHTITISGVNNTTGTYALSLALQEAGESDDSDSDILVYGRTTSGEINDTLYREFWSFRGMRGDVIDVAMSATSGDLDSYVSLISPEGNVIAVSDDDATTQDAALYSVTLESSGTYTISARRAGANFGEGGTTQGSYDLTLTLREAGQSETLPTPVVLTQGRISRGRLTTDAPTALFSIEARGVLALSIDMTDPSQVGTLAIMTQERALLHTASGPSPLYSSVTLPGAGVYWIEVSTTDVRDNAPVDFGLTVTPLTVTQRASRALYYDQPQIIAANSLLPEAWHFDGDRGDVLTLSLTPFGQVMEGSLSIYDPNGALVLERLIRNTLSQPFLLTTSGQYEIIFEPSLISTGYAIGIQRDGLAGMAFDQYAEPLHYTALPTTSTTPAAGVIEPLGTDAWTVDVVRPELWAFTLTATDTNLPLVLALETPDGSLLARTVTEQLTRTARLETILPATGRYRVLVSDFNGTDPTSYTLTGQPAEGGPLTRKITADGVLTPTENYDRWTIDAAPGRLITVRVEAQQSTIAVPDIYIVGPDGAVITSTQYAENDGISATVSAYIETGGQQTVFVRRPPQSERVIYHITADVTAALDEIESLQLGVNATLSTTSEESTPNPSTRIISLTDVVTPLLPAESTILQEARRVEVGTAIRGEIDNYARYQAWEFTASADQMLEFSVIALEDETGPDLVILDANQMVVAEKFVTQTTTNYLAHRFTVNGTYKLLVKLDTGGRYTLWMNTLNRINERVPQVVSGSAIDYGQTMREQLLDGTDTHSFVFFGQTGDAVVANAFATDGAQALKLDLSTVTAGMLASASATSDTQPVTLNTTLTETGLYQLTVALVNGGSSTPSAFALHLGLEGATATINTNGGLLNAEHNAYLSAAGITHHWLVSGEAGERITVNVAAAGTTATAALTVQFADSSGTVFEQRQARLGQEIVTLEDILLPRSGVYQVLVSSTQGTGSYDISLTRDLTGIYDIDHVIEYGQTAGKVLTAENFLDIWSFAGSQGDVVAVTAQPVRGDDALLSVQLRTDAGQVLATVASEQINDTARITEVTLPATGHYSIAVSNLSTDPVGETAYDVTVLLRGTSARAVGSAISYGDAVYSTFYVDDPIDTWVFEGTEGDTIAARVNSSEPGLQPQLSLLSTDWHTASSTGQQQVLTTVNADTNGNATLEFSLPTSGVYALTVRDTMLHGGSYTLELANKTPITGAAQTIRFDQAREGQITDAAVVNAWQFEGTAGATITITTTPNSRGNLKTNIILLGPDGRIMAQVATPAHEEVQLAQYTLPYQGIYTIRVTRILSAKGHTEGSYSIVVHQDAAAVESTPLAYSEIKRGTLDATTPSERWLITGQQDDTIRIRLERTSGDLDPVMRVYNQAGVLLEELHDSQNGNSELLVRIPADDSYTIETERYHGVWGTTSGNYALVVERVYQAASELNNPLLAYGERIEGTTDGDTRSNLWPFSGQAGDVITATITFLSDDAPLTLALYDAAGNTLISGTRNTNTVMIDSFTLPADGVYTLEVRRPGDATARFSPYTLSLNLIGIATPSISPSGTLLQLDHAITCQFNRAHDTQTWFFNGQATDTLALTLLPLYGALDVELALVSPDGTTLFTDTISDQTSAYTTGQMFLPADGLYMLLVHNQGALTNAVYRLALHPIQQNAEAYSIAVGEDRSGTISSVQAFEQWHFTAQASTSISLRVSRVSGNLIPVLTLLGPDNHILVTGVADTYGQAAITIFTIPEDGEYTITVGRDGGLDGATAGAYKVMLREHAISIHAATAQTIDTDTAITGYGDNSGPQLYAFEAQMGDVLAISAQLQDNTPPVLTLAVETETGRTLNIPVNVSGAETYIEALLAPYTGRYIVVVTSAEPSVYTLTIQQREQTAPDTGVTRSLDFGQTLAEVVSDATVPTYWYFSGVQGDVVTITIDTSGSNLRADATLYGPNGLVAQHTENAEKQTLVGPVRLPADGNYVLTVGAWLGVVGGTTGRFTVRTERAPEGVSGSDGGNIPLYGYTVSGGLIPGDSKDLWIFDAQAGEVVTIRATHAPTNSTVALKLLDPDGAVVGASLLATDYQGAEIRDTVLLQNGMYTVQVEAQLANNDPVEYDLVVSESRDSKFASSIAQAQGIAYGETQAGTLQADQLYAAWVFYGSSGDQVRSTLAPGNDTFIPTLYILDPSGAILRGERGQSGDERAVINETTLLTSGFFALVVENTAGIAGDYTLMLERLAAGAGYRGQLSDGAEGTLTADIPVHQWTLITEHAGRYAVVIHPQTLSTTPTVFITGPADVTLAEGNVAVDGSITASAYLEANTAYSVIISAGLGLPNTYYAMQVMPASITGGALDLTPGQPEIGRITTTHLTDEWQFTGPADTATTITVGRAAGNLQALVSLFDENGLLIREAQADDTGRASITVDLTAGTHYRLTVSRAGISEGFTTGDYTVTVDIDGVE